MTAGASLGERLTSLMRRAGLKNPDVAIAARVDATTVSKWRTDVQQPDDAKLALIVDLLASRGITTSVRALRYGENGGRAVIREPGGVPYMFGASQVEFASTTAKQRALLRVQELALEFAEAGADDDFLSWARQFLLNSDNFAHSIGGAAGKSFDMSDEDKLQHIEVLALVPRRILEHRHKKGRQK